MCGIAVGAISSIQARNHGVMRAGSVRFIASAGRTTICQSRRVAKTSRRLWHDSRGRFAIGGRFRWGDHSRGAGGNGKKGSCDVDGAQFRAPKLCADQLRLASASAAVRALRGDSRIALSSVRWSWWRGRDYLRRARPVVRLRLVRRDRPCDALAAWDVVAFRPRRETRWTQMGSVVVGGIRQRESDDRHAERQSTNTQ